MPDCTCEMLHTTEELQNFLSRWKMLWSEDRNATPFQHPDWLLPWWNQFGQQELRAITVSQAGKIIALLPFYVLHKRHSNERQLMLLGVGTTDYLDGLFAPECTLEHIIKGLALLHWQKDWSVLYAGQLRPQSLLFQAMLQMKNLQRFDGQSCSQTRAAAISELPSKIRRNVMYYRNRARRLGTLELHVADESNWSAFFNALVRLHTARWEDQGESGVLADPRVLAWHREALPLLQASGMLRLCALQLNGEIVAVLYSLVDPPGHSERTQYVYLSAHSVEHPDLRAGTLLLGLAMELVAKEGVKTVDMLRGEESYKQIWHVERVPTYGFTMWSRAEERISA